MLCGRQDRLRAFQKPSARNPIAQARWEPAVAGGQLGGDSEATSPGREQQLAPALGTFPNADLEAEQLLLALRG